MNVRCPHCWTQYDDMGTAMHACPKATSPGSLLREPPKTEAQKRKEAPLFSGFMAYFPDAMEAVARLSRIGNEQHNPGTPLHWDRSKSGDEKDALLRHMKDQVKVTIDTDGVPHVVKEAWRAMADCQKYLEENPWN